MILHRIIGLNYYHYVDGVEMNLGEHYNFFCLGWADLGCYCNLQYLMVRGSIFISFGLVFRFQNIQDNN